jgi:hypothetical protein
MVGGACMRRKPCLQAVIWLVLAAALTVLAPKWVATQQAQPPGERVLDLIVMITGQLDGAQRGGAGIVFGGDNDRLFIATANHVVRSGPFDDIWHEATDLRVRFRTRRDSELEARLTSHFDSDLDLAVLAIEGADRHGLNIRNFPTDRLRHPDNLVRGDEVYPVGYPNFVEWGRPVTADRLADVHSDLLTFQSNFIAKGHSGGALLNGYDLELIGMVVADEPPFGRAIDIYAIARKLAAWEYPVKLQLPPPRVSAGDGRTCLLMPRGETRCWGYDDRYELGPLVMDGLRLKSLSTGGMTACGITADGRAFCVGSNRSGQLGDGSTIRRNLPAAVQGGLTFVSISAGGGHTCGISRAGDAYCWGSGTTGRLGSRFPDETSIPSPIRVPSNERFKSVSSSLFYSCALTHAGHAYCWGTVGGATMLRNMPPTAFAGNISFVSLTAGYHHVCGIATTGAAFCWGFNDHGQLGNGATSDAFSEAEARVSGGFSFTSLSAGGSHTCGVATDGKAYCWGLNSFGQLGNGSKLASQVPVEVSGGLLFESISAGNRHTCGVTTSGEVYCWGHNDSGGVGPSGEPEHTRPWRVLAVPSDARFPWRDAAP